MARTKGSFTLGGTLEIEADAPGDARLLVNTKSDLTAAGSFPYKYVGMIVSVASEAKAYMLTAADPTVEANWKEVGSGSGHTIVNGEGTAMTGRTKLQFVGGTVEDDSTNDTTIVTLADSTVYIPAGSVTFANLPVLSSSVVGHVYDVTDAFTSTADFVEGAGIDYPAGTNVAIVDVGTGGTHVYKYDALSGFVDLSDYQTIIQVSALPTASVDELGNIYQYIGATGAGLTNGYFYKCVSDGEATPTYSWAAVAVQAGGSTLSNPITAAIDVGGIDSGTTFAAGTDFETMWDALLNPTLYPTFTAPSASISGTGDKLLEAGSTISATITVTFSRGSINPAYGTTGYRSGAATGYSLNGGTSQVTGTFTESVSGSNNSFQATVSYDAGDQPKDSKGENYSTALAAGSVTTSTLKYEFVDALWANTASIAIIAKLALVSKDAKVKQFDFPAATVANPEVFDVPASWTVTAVEVLNTLANTWENAAAQFTVTDTTHDNAAATSVAYKRYTCNLGYAMGARKVRVKWS